MDITLTDSLTSILPEMTNFLEMDTLIGNQYGGMKYSGPSFLGVPLFEPTSILNLVIRFFYNLLICWIIVKFFYYKKSRRRDYYVTFLLFSSTMFLMIFLMDNLSMQIGFTLGLFAIFGMIRYRTETVPIREMTYLFLIIGISVINALSMAVSIAELLITNGLLIGITWILESQKFLKHTSTKIILYDKIDLIVPERKEELIIDLTNRTGIKIDKYEVGHIDFLRDVAYIKIYYLLDKDETNSIDSFTKLNQFIN